MADTKPTAYTARDKERKAGPSVKTRAVTRPAQAQTAPEDHGKVTVTTLLEPVRLCDYCQSEPGKFEIRHTKWISVLTLLGERCRSELYRQLGYE